MVDERGLVSIRWLRLEEQPRGPVQSLGIYVMSTENGTGPKPQLPRPVATPMATGRQRRRRFTLESTKTRHRRKTEEDARLIEAGMAVDRKLMRVAEQSHCRASIDKGAGEDRNDRQRQKLPTQSTRRYSHLRGPSSDSSSIVDWLPVPTVNQHTPAAPRRLSGRFVSRVDSRLQQRAFDQDMARENGFDCDAVMAVGLAIGTSSGRDTDGEPEEGPPRPSLSVDTGDSEPETLQATIDDYLRDQKEEEVTTFPSTRLQASSVCDLPRTFPFHPHVSSQSGTETDTDSEFYAGGLLTPASSSSANEAEEKPFHVTPGQNVLSKNDLQIVLAGHGLGTLAYHVGTLLRLAEMGCLCSAGFVVEGVGIILAALLIKNWEALYHQFGLSSKPLSAKQGGPKSRSRDRDRPRLSLINLQFHRLPGVDATDDETVFNDSITRPVSDLCCNGYWPHRLEEWSEKWGLSSVLLADVNRTLAADQPPAPHCLFFIHRPVVPGTETLQPSPSLTAHQSPRTHHHHKRPSSDLYGRAGIILSADTRLTCTLADLVSSAIPVQTTSAYFTHWRVYTAVVEHYSHCRRSSIWHAIHIDNLWRHSLTYYHKHKTVHQSPPRQHHHQHQQLSKKLSVCWPALSPFWGEEKKVEVMSQVMAITKEEAVSLLRDKERTVRKSSVKREHSLPRRLVSPSFRHARAARRRRNQSMLNLHSWRDKEAGDISDSESGGETGVSSFSFFGQPDNSGGDTDREADGELDDEADHRSSAAADVGVPPVTLNLLGGRQKWSQSKLSAAATKRQSRSHSRSRSSTVPSRPSTARTTKQTKTKSQQRPTPYAIKDHNSLCVLVSCLPAVQGNSTKERRLRRLRRQATSGTDGRSWKERKTRQDVYCICRSRFRLIEDSTSIINPRNRADSASCLHSLHDLLEANNQSQCHKILFLRIDARESFARRVWSVDIHRVVLRQCRRWFKDLSRTLLLRSLSPPHPVDPKSPVFAPGEPGLALACHRAHHHLHHRHRHACACVATVATVPMTEDWLHLLINGGYCTTNASIQLIQQENPQFQLDTLMPGVGCRPTIPYQQNQRPTGPRVGTVGTGQGQVTKTRQPGSATRSGQPGQPVGPVKKAAVSGGVGRLLGRVGAWFSLQPCEQTKAAYKTRDMDSTKGVPVRGPRGSTSVVFRNNPPQPLTAEGVFRVPPLAPAVTTRGPHQRTRDKDRSTQTDAAKQTTQTYHPPTTHSTDDDANDLPYEDV